MLLTMSVSAGQVRAEKIPVLLDCDTANEIDDLYAIVRGLVEPKFEIVGLTSAHWRTQPNAPKNTVSPSQKLNEKVLGLMGKLDIPHPIGANDAMKGSSTPADSPAARFIIEQAHKMPTGRKLTIITTGTVTNVASAILIDPSIVKKIRCYTMGLRFEDERWITKEFNAGNDLNAIKCLFEAKDFEWHVMTGTASRVLRYSKQRAVKELKGKGGVFDFIIDYWLEFDPPWKPGMNTDSWIMWDIAALEAVIHPEFANEKRVPIPPGGRTKRRVWVYTKIDAGKMQDDFWKALATYRAKKKPTEQTAAPAESHDEEAVIQQPLAGAIEVKNGKQNQQAALAAQPNVATAADWQTYASRYAIIVMSDGRNSDEYFWPATKLMYSYLLEIGFSRENIRFLAPSKYATGHPDIVSGEASETRIEQAYQWAGSACTQEDLLYVYWISHGTSSYFTTTGNSVRHSTLASWMEGIKAKQIIGVYQPCSSGAVVDDISGENIITVTSTDPTTINNWCWGENIAFALAGPSYCDQWMSPGHKLEPARYDVDQDGNEQVSVTEAYIWVAKHRYPEGSMFDDNGDGVGGQWMTDTFDPHDPGKDGCIGNHYSLTGWKPSSITIARKIVDELYEKEGLYYNVIDKLKADKTLDEPVSTVALKIANSHKWQDAERLTKEGWEIVSSADKDIDAYKSVLEKAKKVAGLEPRTPSILTTLGVGQYRVGAYADALDTLKQAEKMRTDSNLGPDPNSAAFTAMTQYQLGHIDEGRSAINTFRDMLEKITFADITSSKLSHGIEAEKVFAGNNNEILAIWELIGTKEFDRAVETFTELQHTTKETDIQFTFSSEGIARYLSRICYVRGKSRLVGQEPDYVNRASDYEAAIRVDPNYVSAIKDLAWLRATCVIEEAKDVKRAVELARLACELTDWKNHECLSVLAGAYSESGRFTDAAKWQQEAIGLLPAEDQAKWGDNYNERLHLYQSDMSYRTGERWSFTEGRIVAFWDFNDVENGVVSNHVGGGPVGRLVGGAEIAADTERGSVLDLHGKSRMECAREAGFDISGSISVGAWIKVRPPTKGWPVIVSKGDRGWAISTYSKIGRVVMSINILKHEEYLQGLASNPIRYITVGGNADLKDKHWHHVAGTYDGTRVCLYIDGALSNSRRVSGNIATNDSIVVIGDNPEWSEPEYDWNWNGLIDDVRIYSYALSPEEVEMLYRGEEPPLKK